MSKVLPFIEAVKNLKRSLLVFIYFFAFFAGSLNAATLFVGPPPASIQAVINIANPGDTVQLSSGTYIEEININKNLTLNGNGVDISIIQCPTTPNPLTNTFVFTTTGATYHPFLMVQGASSVNIQNLTVDGNSQPSNFLSYRFLGIGYHNAGGIIQNVHATNVEDSFPGGGTQHGFAIAGFVDDGNPYSITVESCIIDRFQKAGIDMRGATLTTVISNNTLTGETPPSLANVNGIVIQRGATATITGNTITNMISNTIGNDSVGILMFNAGSNSTVTNNIVNSNNIGIYSATAGANLTVSNNTVSNNDDIGVYVQDTTGLTTLSNNIISNNTNYNLFLYDSSANEPFQMNQNQLIGSNVGLFIQGNTTTGPIVTMNGDSFVGTTTYYIQEQDSPNNIWPSTATVFFDGLISGHITLAEYNQIQAKLFGKQDDPDFGLILQYLIPQPPILTNLSQSSGPDSGGNTITITGSEFYSSNTLVYFGATLATNIVVVSNTQITVTVPPGLGTVDVTVVTPFGTTPIVVADQYTYISAPLPPSNFIGVIKKNKFLNKLEYVLQSTWTASPSANVASYRIYRNNHLVEKISADAPPVFVTCLLTKKTAYEYYIVAVSSNNVESSPVPVRIVND